MSDLPFGIDVSRYQGSINWDAVSINERKVLFSGIRVAISWGYVDPWGETNLKEAGRVGIARAPYHVFYPAQDPIRQADHFLTVVERAGCGWGELPLVADVELHHNVTPAQFQNNLRVYLERLTEVSGRKPIIYSRASFINQYVTGLGNAPQSWLNDYDWWLAQYLMAILNREHAGPPTLPNGVSRGRVLIHQTWDRGPAFGVESKALDYNRWQFDEAHFNAYAGRNEVPPVEEPEPEIDPAEEWKLVLDDARDSENCAYEAYMAAKQVRERAEMLLDE